MALPDHSYVVCSTQRSGSTYLCQLLASTGVAGNPQEYFEATAQTGLPPHPGFFLDGLPRRAAGVRDDDRPGDAPEYSDLTLVGDWGAHLGRTRRLGTTANGVFATKLMWNQLPEVEHYADTVPRLAGLRGYELLERLFDGPGYVWIRRQDKVRQAISLWRALQTRTWRLERQAVNGGASGLKYNFDAIEHLRVRLTAEDASWGRFFTESGAEPLELHYEEDVEPDPVGAVRKVLAHIGIGLPAAWAPATAMVRQSDERTDVWQATYDRDAAARL